MTELVVREKPSIADVMWGLSVNSLRRFCVWKGPGRGSLEIGHLPFPPIVPDRWRNDGSFSHRYSWESWSGSRQNSLIERYGGEFALVRECATPPLGWAFILKGSQAFKMNAQPSKPSIFSWMAIWYQTSLRRVEDIVSNYISSLLLGRYVCSTQ